MLACVRTEKSDNRGATEIKPANVCTDAHGCGTRCLEVLITPCRREEPRRGDYATIRLPGFLRNGSLLLMKRKADVMKLL
jgi:hypothetical protein